MAVATVCIAAPAVSQQSATPPTATQPAPVSPTPTQPAPTPQPAAQSTAQPTTQQAPAALTPAQQAEGEQALAYLLKHEVLDPNALVPGTGKPLPPHGVWSIGKQRPPTCPPAPSQPCVLILYRVPDTPVSCEWTVLLNPNGVNGVILQQNQDSIRYMLRTIPTSEAAPLVISRQSPLNSRPVTRATGTVEIGVIVSTTGEPTQFVPVSGPDQMRIPAIAMAKQWVFRPLTVGSRAIPYEIIIKFHFGGVEVKTEP
jgi:hypothetical protein